MKAAFCNTMTLDISADVQSTRQLGGVGGAEGSGA